MSNASPTDTRSGALAPSLMPSFIGTVPIPSNPAATAKT